MLEKFLLPDDTEERCGLILSDGTAIELPNIAAEPENSYEIDPEGALEHIGNAVGTWHTHPRSDPNLSGEDYRGFLSWPDLEHFIVGRRGGEVVVAKFIVEDGVVIACD